MTTPPTFSGYDPLREPIRTFFEDLETFFAIKGIAAARRPEILDTLIRDPAKEAYDAAAAAGAHDGADAAAEYLARKNWLIARFHGDDEQRIMRNAIREMAQGISESPRQYYGRVVTAVRQGGYPEAARPVLVESAFIQAFTKSYPTTSNRCLT